MPPPRYNPVQTGLLPVIRNPNDLEEDPLPIIDTMPAMIFGVVPMIPTFIGLLGILILAVWLPYPWNLVALGGWFLTFGRIFYLSAGDPNGMRLEMLAFFADVLCYGEPAPLPPPGLYDRGIPDAL